MTSKLRPLAKAVHVTTRCCLDAQRAKQLAFSDSCSELGWSLSETCRELALPLNTVRRWVNGERAVTDELFAHHVCFTELFLKRYLARWTELVRRAA